MNCIETFLYRVAYGTSDTPYSELYFGSKYYLVEFVKNVILVHVNKMNLLKFLAHTYVLVGMDEKDNYEWLAFMVAVPVSPTVYLIHYIESREERKGYASDLVTKFQYEYDVEWCIPHDICSYGGSQFFRNLLTNRFKNYDKFADKMLKHCVPQEYIEEQKALFDE